jgi:two-component system, OmpR family, aerobic respiration control sensor histidine kinase ArcB
MDIDFSEEAEAGKPRKKAKDQELTDPWSSQNRRAGLSAASKQVLSSACLSYLVQAADEAILIEDENGKIIHLNQAFCRFFDISYPPEDFLGVDRERIVRLVPDLFPENSLSLQETTPGGPLSRATKTLRRADGHLLKRDYFPVWQGEKWAGAMWVFKDIIEHVVLAGSGGRQPEKEANKGLPETESWGPLLEQDSEPLQLKADSFVRQVIDASPNPVYVKNQQGKFILVNEAYADLYGFSVAEFSQQDTYFFDFSLDRDLEAIHSETPSFFEEFIKTKDGRKIWFSTVKKPFVRPDGTIYLLSVSSDITDLKRARQLAEDSSAAKEQFLANMSHEIRTPLNAILGMASLLKNSSLSPKQREYTDIMVSSADHLLVMLNDILDFAKINAGKIDLESIHFDLKGTIRKSLNSLVFKAAEKELQLHFRDSGGPLPMVEGDPYRLNQILLNLIGNAIKFTNQGEVVVRATVQERSEKKVYIDNRVIVEFCVQDTGIGISAEKKDLIFESFNQAYNNTSRQFGGTGLGLSICKSLVELQGGKIWIESEIGQGSKFYFTIPYKLSGSSTLLEPGGQKHYPIGLLKNLRVLLVEDNEVNQFLAMTLLQSWEIHTDVASDGQEALQKTFLKKYDLILMDIQMPVMNGVDTTIKIRKKENPNQLTPVIALTANALKTSIENHHLVGFADYLTKPFDEARLFEKIARNTGRDQGAGIESGAAAGEEGGSRSSPSETKGGHYSTRSLPERLYDLSELGSLAYNESFVQKIMQLFVDTVPSELQELESALRTGDRAMARKFSHRLKSTYANLGIRKAASCMRAIEQAAEQEGALEGVFGLLEEAKGLSGVVIEQLREQIGLKG